MTKNINISGSISAIMPDIDVNLMFNSGEFRDISSRLKSFINRFDTGVTYHYQPLASGAFIVVEFVDAIPEEDFIKAQDRLNRIVLRFTKLWNHSESLVNNMLDGKLIKAMNKEVMND